jgi:Dolichyl-phosphate-mannose-protein mannosyltransferase
VAAGAEVESPERVEATRQRLSRIVLVVAGLMFVELMAYAGRYGYHRDEMYFIVAGSHPAFGYPDQPPLVPLLAWLMHDIAPSLYVLRLPSALAAAATVVVCGATAREAGGGRRAQVIAALVAAVSAISLATGHFVTTTTFDVLSTAVLGWLLVRVLMRHDPRSLLWAGVVVGVGFEAKPQVAVVAFVAIVSLALVGPRWVLRSPRLWAGIAIAVVLATPYLIWQQRHGWPQLTVAGNIAGQAESGRAGFIPFQLVMVSPVLVPVWVAGLVSAWRNPAMRALRVIPVLYGLLAVAYLVGDGKAYYLASLYPTVIGLGAIPTASWLSRGHRPRLRRASLGVAIALSALISAVVALPVLPESQLPGSASIALNPDLGETVGWPQFIATVNSAWHDLPPATQAHAVIFTANYGEAGAIDVLGRGDGLPLAFSGHNGFSLWGQPPPEATTTIVLGYSAQQLSPFFTGCRVVARISNPVKLDNDEYGDPVIQCSGLTAPWSQLWPRLRHYD